jgi:hypothetical protein
MAEAPVCAALEWRRVRVWGSGMFLFGRQLEAVDLEYGFGVFFLVFLDGGKLKEGVFGGKLTSVDTAALRRKL